MGVAADVEADGVTVTNQQLVDFVRDVYGPAMAERMAVLFLEREPRDDVERGFVRSVRRSLEREMAERDGAR